MSNLHQQQSNVLVYTRKPKNEYTESLSNSVHFAYNDGESGFQPLNRNYGILFALASIDEQNVIQEKGLKNPYLFKTKEGLFGIIAVRTDKFGNDDEESKGQILLWTSDDLINFRDHGLIMLHKNLLVKEAVCSWNNDCNSYEICWIDNDGNSYINRISDLMKTNMISSPESTNTYEFEHPFIDLPDIIPGNILSIESGILNSFREHWTTINNTKIHVPESITLASKEQLREVHAIATYSDGSTAEKKVEWELDNIDFSVPGIYKVKGKAVQKTFSFPLARGYADPVILTWNGKYYFLATNDNKNDIGMYVREGDTIAELFAPGFKEAIILDVDEDRDFIQTFWAPEFHIIGDDLYILFAVGGKQWAPQCHMMKLKKGGNIMNAIDWNTPERVRLSNGNFLTEDGITLDMTYFKADGISCLVWSYRKGIGTPLDTGSMLYIATIDEKDPTILTSDPVLLSRPLFGWENIQGTINNEGPYALVTDDMVYITYSGGAAGGYTYALGLLSIPRGSNYMDANAWTKSSAPVLSYYSIDGIYGPGHNSFFRDYDGNVFIMYHVEEEIVKNGIRCSAMHRVHFNRDGYPVFHMSAGKDLNENLVNVSMNVIIK